MRSVRVPLRWLVEATDWSEAEGATLSLNPAFPPRLASTFPEQFVHGPVTVSVFVHGFCCVFEPRVEL